MKIIYSLILAIAASSLVSCNHLSSEAKKIAGDYYIPELSEDLPMLELKRNGTCIIRTTKPGVLTYGVEGKWNVKNDSLIAKLDTAKVTFIGDSLLIGHIPLEFKRRVVSHSDLSLELENRGVRYVYQRRYKND